MVPRRAPDPFHDKAAPEAVMVQATRWRQDSRLLPTNPFQRIRFSPTFPSGGGGDSAFGWSPVSIDGAMRFVGSAAGTIDSSGLSGPIRGLGLSVDTGGLLRGLFALGGIGLGVWLAKRNLGR